MISKTETLNIARERIIILLDLARSTFESNSEQSTRYCELVDKVRMRFNIRLTKEQKKMFCKECHSYWVEGKTVKINNKIKPNEHVCLVCGFKRKL